MMRSAISVVCLLVAVVAIGVLVRAQGQAPSPVRFVNPPGLSTPTGYTHLVETSGGRTLYIAGQVAADRTGAVVGKGDLRAQATQVFENLKVALAAGNAGFQNVVKINMYVTDMTNVAVLREVRGQYMTGNLPASTLVQVVQLARPEYLLEIEAIAVAP